MSDFLIQEKPFGSSPKTIITDINGHPLYLLIGRLDDIGSRLTLYDMDGKAVAYIKKDRLAFVRRFEIYENDKKVGIMQHFLNWPNDFYYISQLHWMAHGNIYHHEYRVRHFANEIMTMSKTRLMMGDHYQLHVHDDANAPKCICIASVLDYWSYNRERSQPTYYKEVLDVT